MTIIPGAERYQLWGSLVSCGRLSIGLARFRAKRRRLPTAAQDAILPHTISIIDSTLDALH
jgi:hypothetical protein